jgi:hypothetical protein
MLSVVHNTEFLVTCEFLAQKYRIHHSYYSLEKINKGARVSDGSVLKETNSLKKSRKVCSNYNRLRLLIEVYSLFTTI